MSDHDHYQSPLSTRYAGEAMRVTFSERKKFVTWHRIWLALAESQRELGLPISEAQLAELRANIEHVDFELAARYERELRHDVMAHVHAWGERCPAARGILHLGATSCDVTDNADLVILREALGLVRAELVNVLRALRRFALEWRALPVLGLTHLQPAQATTLGKRATLWIQDFAFNLAELDEVERRILFRGIKGTTGTQASFLSLFQGEHEKVRELERRVARRMGFEKCFPVTGQTYPRQLDFRIGAALAGIAQSGAKFGSDLRLLAARREVQEPFGKQQIGSSAMPWKRNPMRAERVCSLARHVLAQLDALAHTAANQWLERTLDDSAVRRLALPEMFLATDGLLELVLDVGSGLVVHPRRIERNLAEEAMLAEIESIRHCPSCDRRVDPEWIICPTCRTRLNRVCPNCTKLVGLDWSLCAWCGKDFERRDVTAAPVPVVRVPAREALPEPVVRRPAAAEIRTSVRPSGAPGATGPAARTTDTLAES